MHLHKMRDSDNHFIIDPTTMIITNKSEKHTLQQGDHNSEVFTFELPKVIEGHDMTQCNLVQIHYINIKGDKTEQIKDVHKVNDIAVSEDEPGTLVFTWTVHGNATKYAGSLNFRIHFYCTDTDGKYTYKKHTEIFKGITISEGFDNAEAVEKDHSDILAQWESRLNALENSGGDSAVLYTEQKLTEGQKAQARKNIGVTTPYVFKVKAYKVHEYLYEHRIDETTFNWEDMHNAVLNGREVICIEYADIYNNPDYLNIFRLVSIVDETATFWCISDETEASYIMVLIITKGSNQINIDFLERDFAVLCKPQDLYEDQKAQARKNIDAVSTEQLEKTIANIPDGLPTVSAADAGKFLRVSADGEWQAQTVVNAEEVAF